MRYVLLCPDDLLEHLAAGRLWHTGGRVLANNDQRQLVGLPNVIRLPVAAL